MKTRKGGKRSTKRLKGGLWGFFESKPEPAGIELTSSNPSTAPGSAPGSALPTDPNIKSPFITTRDNKQVLNSNFFNARDFINEGVGTKITKEEADVINQQIEAEIKDPTSENLLVAEGLDKAYSMDGKIKKAIVSAIGVYNTFEAKRDKMNPHYLTKKVARSSTKCGSVTCKVRGHKIAKALQEILALGESTLGSISSVSALGMGVLNYGKEITGFKKGGTRRR